MANGPLELLSPNRNSLTPNPTLLHPLPTPALPTALPTQAERGKTGDTKMFKQKQRKKSGKQKRKNTKTAHKEEKKGVDFCIRTHMRNCNNNGASQNGEINHPKDLLKKNKRETERKNRKKKRRNNKKHRSGPPFGQCRFEGPCGFARLGSAFSVHHRQISTLPTNRQPPTANRSLCQPSRCQPHRHRTTTAFCVSRLVFVETCDLMLLKRILWISEFCFAILQCILITRHSDATFLQTH